MKFTDNCIFSETDRWYLQKEAMIFTDVYYNPDATSGGQLVIMIVPYECISDAVERTNTVQGFFDYLEEVANIELIDITDQFFDAVIKDYQDLSPILIGRSDEVMLLMIKIVAEEVETDDVLNSYLEEVLALTKEEGSNNGHFYC